MLQPIRFVKSEIRDCVLTGIILATIVSLVATVGYAINPSRVVTKTGLHLWQVVFAYYCGGIVGGAICGSLLWWVDSTFKAAIVGFFSVMPFALALMLQMLPREQWFPVGIVAAAIFSLMFGSGIASVTRPIG
jgi:hypothetical protein